jgi:hypothetical protein
MTVFRESLALLLCLFTVKDAVRGCGIAFEADQPLSPWPSSGVADPSFGARERVNLSEQSAVARFNDQGLTRVSQTIDGIGLPEKDFEKSNRTDTDFLHQIFAENTREMHAILHRCCLLLVVTSLLVLLMKVFSPGVFFGEDYRESYANIRKLYTDGLKVLAVYVSVAMWMKFNIPEDIDTTTEYAIRGLFDNVSTMIVVYVSLGVLMKIASPL